MPDETQPQRRARALLWILIGGGAFFLFLLAVFSLLYITLRPASEESSSVFAGDNRIGVVDLEGLIVTPEVVVRQLKRFGDDDSIKAIILHINTPGGGVAATEEIYQEVRRIEQEKHKKVIASVETVGASGGYFVASACNKIFADKGSIVGSIGVIAEWVNYGKLMDWAKLQDITMKAGKLKDAGSPTRPMTPEEKAYFQSLLDNMHSLFIQAVADGRHLKVPDVQAIADGRVWTGDQALPLHLIDQVGDFRAAVKDTAQSVGIKGEPHLVRPEKERRTLLDLLFGDLSNFLPDRLKLLQTQVGFYYVWQ
ncbi:MAG TPA: signal peptide peptidase SppA [Terriglobales bacterium]|jgi:protease IV|nr:signal peptide peptidase SppA [Terriglobales bacterium]